MLDIIRAYERCDWQQVDRLVKLLGVQGKEVAFCYRDALTWSKGWLEFDGGPKSAFNFHSRFEAVCIKFVAEAALLHENINILLHNGRNNFVFDFGDVYNIDNAAILVGKNRLPSGAGHFTIGLATKLPAIQRGRALMGYGSMFRIRWVIEKLLTSQISSLSYPNPISGYGFDNMTTDVSDEVKWNTDITLAKKQSITQ